MFSKGHRPSHYGKVTTTEPIKTLDAIADIKKYLRYKPRDLAMFTVAVNTAFRASDITSLVFENLKALQDGTIEITKRERKTKKLRVVILNKSSSTILKDYISMCRNTRPNDLVFPGIRGQMGTSYFGRLVKTWLKEGALLDGRFATHSLRKTFVYTQYKTFGVELPVLMNILNHSSQLQTLKYMGSMTEEMLNAYQNEI